VPLQKSGFLVILTLLCQIDVLTTNGKTLAQACKEVGTVEQATIDLSGFIGPISSRNSGSRG